MAHESLIRYITININRLPITKEIFLKENIFLNTKRRVGGNNLVNWMSTCTLKLTLCATDYNRNISFWDKLI